FRRVLFRSGPETATQEVASVEAGDERVKAAGVVVGVVGAAGLVAVDLVGDGVEIEGRFLAIGGQEGDDDAPEDLLEPGGVRLLAERVEQARERRLGTETIGRAAAPGPKRALAAPRGDGQTQD